MDLFSNGILCALQQQGWHMLHTRYSDKDKAFLEALRAKRKQAGLSQIVMAEKLGTTQSTVSKMERGELRLDVIDFVHVCEVLNVKPSQMMAEVFES